MTTATTLTLTQKTFDILKNFSTINSNILVKPGSVIRTISPIKNVMAEATIEETFDVEFGIWDLNKFLGTISLFTNPEFEFHEKYVTIRDEKRNTEVTYYYSEPKLLTVPSKEITMPECEVSFSLENGLLSNVQKAAAVIGVPDMALESVDSGVALLKVTDKKNATANDYAVKIDVNNNNDGKNLTYKFWFKVENLKLLSGTYDVGVSSKSISHFVNKNVDVQYWIALEPESKYDA